MYATSFHDIHMIVGLDKECNIQLLGRKPRRMESLEEKQRKPGNVSILEHDIHYSIVTRFVHWSAWPSIHYAS